MNITRENTGDLTATLKIEIGKEDYEEKVNKVIRDYQRKANIPGFRPGKVPFGMIKKMYGNALKAEEINKLISDSIASYLEAEKIDILGNPLPNTEKNDGIDFESRDSFELYFDLGLTPEIPLDLAGMKDVERYRIRVSDEMVEGYVRDARKRFGTTTTPETAGPEDTLRGDIAQTDADGTILEDGVKKSAYLSLARIKEGDVKTKLTGLKKGETLSFLPTDLYTTAEEAAKELGISKEQAENPAMVFQFTLSDIYHLDDAEMNPDFFNQVFPEKNVETEEDFREMVRNDAAQAFTPETDRLFFRVITDRLIEEVQFPLPDSFLKRWLLESRENRMTPEEMEKQYDLFAKSMRWQLIENKLIRENEISVRQEDIRNYIRNYFLRQIPMNLEADPEAEKRYDSLVDTVMKNKEQVTKINDELYTAKLLDLFLNQLSITETEISYEEFVKKASALRDADHLHHDHHHDHDHEHDHDHTHDHDHDHQHHHHTH